MNLHRLLIYGAAFTIIGLSNAVIPIIPELANLSNSFSGGFASSLLFSAYFIGAMGTMLPFGIFTDRFGNSKFIGLGIVLTAISGLIIMYSGNLWILLIARFIEGSACGAFFPAAFAVLSKLRNPARYIGELTFFSTLAWQQEPFSRGCWQTSLPERSNLYLYSRCFSFDNVPAFQV